MKKLSLLAGAFLLAFEATASADAVGFNCTLTLPGQKVEFYHISLDPAAGRYTMRAGQKFDRIVAKGAQFEFVYSFGANMQSSVQAAKLFFPMTPPYAVLVIDLRNNVTATTISGAQPFPVGPCRVDEFKGL